VSRPILHCTIWSSSSSALYSYLAHHAYLSAAYLWLVARVVKENLASMPDDVKQVSRCYVTVPNLGDASSCIALCVPAPEAMGYFTSLSWSDCQPSHCISAFERQVGRQSESRMSCKAKLTLDSVRDCSSHHTSGQPSPDGSAQPVSLTAKQSSARYPLSYNTRQPSISCDSAQQAKNKLET
jgi:hypothetical protein